MSAEKDKLLHLRGDEENALPVESTKRKPAGKGEAGDARAKALLVTAICLYALCSSSLLVINKLSVHLLPAPSFVLFLQLLSSAVFVACLGRAGVVRTDKLEWKKVKAFGPVAVAFLASVFANIKILQYANVETFIVFRSSTPLVISVLDYLFLGRQLPSLRSCASLTVILLGSIGYVVTDAQFYLTAYFWVVAWLVIFCFDQIFIKHVVDNVEMTNWGRVFYTNFLALFPLLLVGILDGDAAVLASFEWSVPSVAAITASCLAGIGMSYWSFMLRSLVSATTFTVVGIMCKVATVLVNLAIWDKHAHAVGLACITLCLLAGSFYQQAPLRTK
eukprot:jgi/Mesvir1/23207/Mv22669-RA.1